MGDSRILDRREHVHANTEDCRYVTRVRMTSSDPGSPSPILTVFPPLIFILMAYGKAAGELAPVTVTKRQIFTNMYMLILLFCYCFGQIHG